MDKKREVFEKMPVPKALATLAIPTIISQLITMIYNLADTFFIGLADDPSQTAASSLAVTLVFMMNCIPFCPLCPVFPQRKSETCPSALLP